MATNKTPARMASYGWVALNEPGTLTWLPKTELHVDRAYQREANLIKARRIAAAFDWPAFGVLSVAERNGSYYIFDGGHRWNATMLRSDITTLPCVVFRSDEQRSEAQKFLMANTNRRPVEMLEKFHALIMAGDEAAVFVDEMIRDSGRVPERSGGPGGVRCVRMLMKWAVTNRGCLERMWPLVVSLCDGASIHERIIDALMYMETHMPEGESLLDARWRPRLLAMGNAGVRRACDEAGAYYARGGAKVWAAGIVKALNKGLRRPLVLTGAALNDE